MLHYDQLDVPFDLIRNLVRWHDLFDALPTHEEPPAGVQEAFIAEKKALVIRLADALGPDVQVE